MSRQIEVPIVQVLAEWVQHREDIEPGSIETIQFHLAAQPGLTVIQAQDTMIMELSQKSQPEAPSFEPGDATHPRYHEEPERSEAPEVVARVYLPGSCLFCHQKGTHTETCRFAEA